MAWKARLSAEGPLCATAAALGAALLLTGGVPAPAAPACHSLSIEAVAKAWDDFVAQPDVTLSAETDLYQCVTSDKTLSTACQTMPEHPAHPSVVIRRVVRGKGGWWMRTEATTAAPCTAPFFAMLREFEALTDEMRARLAAARKQQSPASR